MNKGLFNKILPHLIAVVIFLIVAVIYCKPALEGKVLNQHDIIGWKGMAQQSMEYREQHGRYPLWTNSLFSGMPAYTIAMEPSHNVSTIYLYALLNLGLPKPINFFFLACICFYFLCQVFRINPWLSIMAALAFAYASYDPVIIAVGHDTKMRAIALAPAVIGSLILILQRKYLWGAALLTLFFGFQVATQHLQIVYYTGITVGFIVIAYLIHSWKKENLKSILLSLGVAVAAAAIGFFTFAVLMLPIREYAKETMRGGQSELTQPNAGGNKTRDGLDKDYAFNWSYGVGETFTFIVPGIYGGSNGGHEHDAPTKFTEKLAELSVPEDQALQMVNGYSYWGTQPSTSGTVYLGAIVCFLFILGMVFLNTWHKWWMIAAALFMVLLAWGKNFSALNYFLFDYLPLYNKFRAPSIALIIPQLIFPLTGAMVLQQILFGNVDREQLWKKFKLAVGITGGVIALLFFMYISFDYKGANDNAIQENFTAMLSQGQQAPQQLQQAQGVAQSLMQALQNDRQSLFGSDLLRSFIFILLAVVLVGAALKNKITPIVASIALLVLVTFDLFGIAKRYLNEDSFVEEEQYESVFVPRQADNQILQDKALPYRVFDQTEDPFQNSTASARTSYYHNSIGGYSPAKLSLYHDIIEHQLSKGNMQVYNMLNTKYFITPNPAGGEPQAQVNPNAFGPVWLAKAVKLVKNADEEMLALSSTSLRDTAVVQQKFSNSVKAVSVQDSAATISVAQHSNDAISYKFSSKTDQFAVFSEVYYPLGWNAYIDGKKTDYVKVNYILRGLSIPAGNHTIEFKFEPESYTFANTLMLITSIIAYLLLIAAIVWSIRKSKAKDVATR